MWIEKRILASGEIGFYVCGREADGNRTSRPAGKSMAMAKEVLRRMKSDRGTKQKRKLIRHIAADIAWRLKVSKGESLRRRIKYVAERIYSQWVASVIFCHHNHQNNKYNG